MIGWLTIILRPRLALCSLCLVLLPGRLSQFPTEEDGQIVIE